MEEIDDRTMEEIYVDPTVYVARNLYQASENLDEEVLYHLYYVVDNATFISVVRRNLAVFIEKMVRTYEVSGNHPVVANYN